MPNADGTLTAEEALEAEFAPDPPATEPAPVEPPAAPTGGKIKVGENEYDPAELQTLVEFQQWALEHNEEMNHFGAYLRGEAEFTPKGQAPAKPTTEDEDPYASIEDEGLRERLRTQEQQLEALRTATSSVVTARSLEEADRAINRAYDTIKEKYGLDDDEVREIATSTAQSGILPGIRSSRPDPYEAAVAALDVTYWSDQKYRDKAVEKEILRLDSHQQRQALAGVVGGASGSVSREVPSDEEVAKMTPQEKASAMAAEIAASFRGTT